MSHTCVHELVSLRCDFYSSDIHYIIKRFTFTTARMRTFCL